MFHSLQQSADLLQVLPRTPPGLDDPALRQLQMPAVFRADRDHDPSWFPGFENHHYLIDLGLLQVWFDGIRLTNHT